AYQHDWLASSRDGLYSTSGTFVVKPVTRPVSTNVGQELDLQAKYNWNSALELGVGYAHFFTGEFLNQTTKGRDFNYPYCMLTYTF
ncbi:MAG TPA: alginate export family protein, partial [Bryobacteraceae bacterium]